jgi:hypothetical protein
MKQIIRFTSAIDVARDQLEGRASAYIKPFDITPGDVVDLWCRVSSPHQGRTENPSDQEKELRAAVEQRGGVVGIVTKYEGSGKIQRSDFDPNPLSNAARKAKRRGAILLAESTGRFVRHVHFIPNLDRTPSPSDDDLQGLAFWTLGVPLMTLADPDDPIGVVRGRESARGQRQKNRKGGRPMSKKRRKEEKLEQVLCLHYYGWGYRRIGEYVDVPWRTVKDWIVK